MMRHILLIDDSEAIQLAISSVLSENDYALTTASDGTEGLASLEHQAYDLVLLDYALPDMDGLQVLQQIVSSEPDLPVIMVTGSGSERLAVNALKSGASDYVVKTNDFIAKLPHIIRDTLEKCEIQRRNRELEGQLRESYKQLKRLNSELEEKVQGRTEELERAYQLSNELMAKAVDSNMQLAELYSEVDESRRKLDAKIRELSLLNEVGRKMAAAQDQDTLLQVALDSMSQELDADHCAILLLSPDSRHLQVGASRGTPDDLFLAANALNGEHILLQIIQEGKPVLLQDIEADARFAPLVQNFPDVDSCMLVPLSVRQLDVGIVTMYGYDTRKTLTQDEFEFISSLASQTAISLANIQLTERRIQHEQMGKLGKIMQYILQQFTPSFDGLRQYAGHLEGVDPAAGRSPEIGHNILAELERLENIIGDLLEFARGQRGTLQVETVTVKDLFEKFLAAIEPTFTERHLSIQTNLQYTGDITLDVHKITRAFMIIVENAEQAMPEGGTLHILSREENHGIQIEFIDTGCGMSPDLQAHMFEPFVSGAGTRGAGLGLTIAQKILNEHRAHVEVQSVLTQGTTVRIWLPRIQHVHHANNVVQRAEHAEITRLT